VTKPVLIVVDDEPAMGQLVAHIAKNLGFDSHFAKSVREFRTLQGRFSPQVIVTDLIMPDMDGIELIQELTAKHSKASLIVMSGYHATYLEVAGQLATYGGLNLIGTVVKPFQVETMEEMLRKALPRTES